MPATAVEEAAAKEAAKVTRMLVAVHEAAAAGYMAGLKEQKPKPPTGEPQRHAYLAAHSRGTSAGQHLNPGETPVPETPRPGKNAAELIAAISARPPQQPGPASPETHSEGRNRVAEEEDRCGARREKGKEEEAPEPAPKNHELARVP